MAITSESQMIDVIAISNGCSIIEEAARDYANCANKVKEAAAICTDKALSVEKKSMQPSLQELGDSISTIQGNIEYFTSQIRNVAQKIRDQQYAEYQAYLDALEKQRQAEEEAARAAAAANANASGNNS